MIKIKKLNFSINNKDILKNIELNIEKGKFVGIIGENGSGKTTLLKNIYRFYKKCKKTIYLDGRFLEDYGIKEFSKKMSVLSQVQKIDFDFKVKEIIEMGLYNKGFFYFLEQDNNIKEVLKFMGLEDMENKSILNLSGGEIQRTYIARTLIQNSEIVVLDEPTNHLDIKYQHKVMSSLKSISKTVVAVIHDINIASKYCDYIVALKDGEILFQGKTLNVINKENIEKLYKISNIEVIYSKCGYPVVIF